MEKVDWFQFRSLTEHVADIPRVISKDWVDTECETITDLIKNSLTATAPLITIKPKIRKQAFWNEKLSAMRINLRTLYRCYRQSHDTTDWDAYIAARQEFKRTLCKAKRRSWQMFTEEHKGPKELSKLFRAVQVKTHEQIDLLSGADSPQETVSLLMSTHFPGSVDEFDFRQTDSTPVVFNINESNAFITPEKVRWSINSFDAHKAAGPDGIKIAVLREIGPNMINRLTNLYRSSMQLSYVPKCLRTAKVIFIPKPDKEDYSLPKALSLIHI